ncbi:MAG: AMP-binding protein, partial [Pseudomonadota bacterium]|nr:AMP-binding protein [Pseudomonadota bacterium]
NVNNFAAAATVYRMLRKSCKDQNLKLAISKCSFTGEPLDPDTFDWVRKYFGVSPASIYGTTEVGVVMVDYPGMKGHHIRRGSLGKPAPGNVVAILNDKDEIVGANEIGEISVKRKGEWFRVKDFGYYDEEGYFFHAGRSDDVIISAGWTMSAVEIENILLTHESVVEAAVIGIPDELRGQVARAYVVLEKGVESDGETIKRYMKDRLSKHEYPREVVFLQRLPKTPAGKVSRKALRDEARREGI